MYNKTALDSGVRIVTESLPHSRVVAVGIWVDVGSRDEHDLNNGSAHFVEHMFFKGTRHRSAQQIARELDVLGGVSNAFTSREVTCFYATVLDIHLPKLVDLYSDLFFNSLFSEEEIERERHVILQEISMVEDMPDEYIHDLFAALLWGRHPLGKSILGSREVVSAMDSKKLLDYVERFYLPGKILISAAGNVDHNNFVELWEKKFAASGAGIMKRNRNGLPARQAPPKLTAKRVVYDKSLEQVHMLIGTYGLPVVAEERYKFILLNVLLGGNMSSRLFQEIREKRGLAYSIYSYITSFLDCGYLAIYVGVEKSSLNEALAVIAKEVQKLRKDTIPAAELEDNKEFLRGGLYLSAENMEAIMMRIARNELWFGRYIALDEEMAAIEQVRSQDVTALAESIFGANEFTVSVLGPLDPDEIDWEPLDG